MNGRPAFKQLSGEAMTTVLRAPVTPGMGEQPLRKEQRERWHAEETGSYFLALYLAFYKKHMELFKRWQTRQALSSCLDNSSFQGTPLATIRRTHAS